ncbi:probable peptide/nitrate transporter At3g43790 isoform X2 [Nematostella vectensis]|uniref:probable peptide/nitrate transporter At3g43790 isoform X2 n=1 Tax=Nematostella vectensis TaxID=45351 RepID=UPI002077602D|nr:probable peptide/nitrate transporter At3g43790 isoform X2 [Nematostella vectensis]
MQRIKIFCRNVIYPPGATPLPWKTIILLFVSLIGTAMTISLLFPFLPAMVKWFGKSEQEAGYSAGLIASAYFMGRAVSGYFWGMLSDKFGRRPIMLISVLMLASTTLMFGFSESVTWAVATRAAAGFSNGVIGTAKTIISEICDNSNQALGITMVTVAWTTGMVLGPAIGGYLAEPGEKYPSTFSPGSLFHRFAFLMPNAINSALLMVGFLALFFGLQETLQKSEKPLVDLKAVSSKVEGTRASQNVNNENKTEDTSSDYEMNIRSRKTEDVKKHLSKNGLPSGDLACRDVCEAEKNSIRTCMSNEDPPTDKPGVCCVCLAKYRGSNFMKILRDQGAVISIITYSVFSFAHIGTDELFNLWVATEPRYGGLGFSTDQIGTVLLISGLVLTFLGPTVLPKIEQKIGSILMFQIFATLAIFTTIILPCLRAAYDMPVTLWTCFLPIVMTHQLSANGSFLAVFIFINNSVPSELLGTVNGLSMAVTSVFSQDLNKQKIRPKARTEDTALFRRRKVVETTPVWESAV